MGDPLAILTISMMVGNSVWHKQDHSFVMILRFNHYLSVTAIGGFCDGIHGVVQGIAGGDNGT